MHVLLKKTFNLTYWPREQVDIMKLCNQDYNYCVQKHMNILPAKKNSSWKDACNNLQQVNVN